MFPAKNPPAISAATAATAPKRKPLVLMPSHASPPTIGRLADTPGLGVLGDIRRRLGERIVLDHFETFEYSQDLPTSTPHRTTAPVGRAAAWRGVRAWR